MRANIVSVLLLLSAGLSFPGTSFAATESLWVGETYRCDATSSASSLTSDISWSTSGGYITLSGSGLYRDVTATQYWSGTATVTCSWKYRLYSNDTWKTKTKSWTFTCSENPVSISPTSMTLAIGESGNVGYSHKYSNNYVNAANVYFSSSNSNIASVSSSGQVTGKSSGTCYVTVYSNLSNAANAPSCKITVKDENGDTPGNTTDKERRTIHLDEAGTLSSYISDADKYNITELTLSGCINGSDLMLLRDMAGCDRNRKETKGVLKKLDLRNAVIVSGGSWYVDSGGYKFFTEDSSVFPKNAFAWCPKLAKLYLPLVTTSIGREALLWCEGLTDVEIPIGTLEIEDFNITYCYDMTSLTIPSTVTRINTNFYDTKKLQYIHCNAVEPPVMTSSFSSGTNIRKGILYVPKGSSNKYWKAKGWTDFGDIVEVDNVEYPVTVKLTKGGKVVCGETYIRKYTEELDYDGTCVFGLPEKGTLSLQIVPDDAHIIEKVLLDGEDVTEDVSDGTFVISSNGNARTFNVSFKDETTSIKSLSTDMESKAQIRIVDDCIFIKGVVVGNAINIYNVMGNKVFSTLSNGEENVVRLAKNNVYIINIGKERYKIVM